MAIKTAMVVLVVLVLFSALVWASMTMITPCNLPKCVPPPRSQREKLHGRK